MLLIDSHELRMIHCSMVYLTRDHTLKKTSCSSPNSHQPPIASQLEVWFPEPRCHSYWNIDWLDPVLASVAAVSS